MADGHWLKSYLCKQPLEATEWGKMLFKKKKCQVQLHWPSRSWKQLFVRILLFLVLAFCNRLKTLRAIHYDSCLLLWPWPLETLWSCLSFLKMLILLTFVLGFFNSFYFGNKAFYMKTHYFVTRRINELCNKVTFCYQVNTHHMFVRRILHNRKTTTTKTFQTLWMWPNVRIKKFMWSLQIVS